MHATVVACVGRNSYAFGRVRRREPRTAVVLNKGGQHVEQVLVLGVRVSDCDARVEERQPLVSSDEDVAWVQVAVHEIVHKDHLDDGIDTVVADALSCRGVGIGTSRPREERLAVDEGLDEDVARHVRSQRLREADGGTLRREVAAKAVEVGSLDAQVELHHEQPCQNATAERAHGHTRHVTARRSVTRMDVD